MKPKNLYKNGLPFDSTLARNIDNLKERINMGKASLLIIDGGLGEGKTIKDHIHDKLDQDPDLQRFKKKIEELMFK